MPISRDGDGIGYLLVFGPVLIDIGRFTLRWDMKMDGEGMLLIGLVSRSPVLFARVGGWGAGLPDSSSDGSPATWAPSWGVRVSCGLYRVGR